MLYYLFQYLNSIDFPGAGVFNYITFRAAVAVILSLVISMVFGKRIIGWLQKNQFCETVRDLGLEGQMQKQGTPTMGGLIILASILVPVLLVGKLDNVYVQIMIISTVGFGLIGFTDDYLKIKYKNKDGLAGKFKIVGQVLVGLIAGGMLYFSDGTVIRHKEFVVDTATVTVQNQSETSASKQKDYVWQETKGLKTTIPFIKNNKQ